MNTRAGEIDLWVAAACAANQVVSAANPKIRPPDSYRRPPYANCYVYKDKLILTQAFGQQVCFHRQTGPRAIPNVQLTSAPLIKRTKHVSDAEIQFKQPR